MAKDYMMDRALEHGDIDFYLELRESERYLQEQEMREQREEERLRKEKLWQESIGYKDQSDYRAPTSIVSKEQEDLYNKEKDFVISAGQGNLEECKLLLSIGVNVNANNCVGTALGRAAGSGRIDVCKFLISKGAYLELYSIAGETPLMLAAEYGQLDVCKLLVHHGADVNVIRGNIDSIQTIHYYAKRHPAILDFLKENGLRELNTEKKSEEVVVINEYGQDSIDTPLVGEESSQENNDSILSWCTIL
jgi:ankyrin repeat protein